MFSSKCCAVELWNLLCFYSTLSDWCAHSRFDRILHDETFVLPPPLFPASLFRSFKERTDLCLRIDTETVYLCFLPTSIHFYSHAISSNQWSRNCFWFFMLLFWLRSYLCHWPHSPTFQQYASNYLLSAAVTYQPLIICSV